MSSLWKDDYGYLRTGWIIAIIIAIALAAVALLGAIIAPIAYFAERADCRSFGAQTERNVRFVHLVDPGVPLSWDCLVQTKNGRWISRSQLRSVDES